MRGNLSLVLILWFRALLLVLLLMLMVIILLIFQGVSSLRFSFIGYVDQVFVITNQTSLNVRLIEDSELLDELVVVGYGVQRKSVVTAAISQVTAEELNVTRPTRVEDALKGKVSGVQITQSSGQPGSDSKVRIRGIGTRSEERRVGKECRSRW